MTQTIDDTLAERGERYGEFEGHASITQNIKAAMADSDSWGNLDDDIKECLEMIAHKIGRVLNGDPYYPDNFTDICGYARLVEKRLLLRADHAANDSPPVQTSAKPVSTAQLVDALSILIRAGVLHQLNDE